MASISSDVSAPASTKNTPATRSRAAAASLKRSDRILEIRRRRIFSDSVDFGTVIGQGPIKRRAEMVGLDRLKWRELKRSGPFGKKRVLHFGWGTFHIAYIG